jgi:DNA-binding transcriptional MocR family regulator
MALPRITSKGDDSPKYLRLARNFERQIRSGTLRIGDRLPSVRQLKTEHCVSASTAVGCYLWLERQGYVRARAKSGFYVARRPTAESTAPGIAATSPRPVTVRHVAGSTAACDTAIAQDVLDLGPAIVGAAYLPMKQLNRSIRMALSTFADHAVRYEHPSGSLRLRQQIARLMFRQGASATAEDILITSGQTEALNIAIRAVAKAGDVIAVESEGCYEILRAIESFGMRALEVQHVLHRGIDLDALRSASTKHTIKAVITNASCHNPMGDCASEDAKAALVEFAAANKIAIIEGDTFGDLVFSGTRPTTLKAYDTTGVVILCASLAHYVAPGFNLGWISAGRWHEDAVRLKGTTNLANARLPQLALAEFLESGGLERHLKRLRTALCQSVQAARDEVLRTFPTGTRVSDPEGGFVLWIQLPGGYDGATVARQALEAGIKILPGEIFSPTRQYRDCIRINCGVPVDVLQPAIRRLATLLEDVYPHISDTPSAITGL